MIDANVNVRVYREQQKHYFLKKMKRKRRKMGNHAVGDDSSISVIYDKSALLATVVVAFFGHIDVCSVLSRLLHRCLMFQIQ